METFVRQSVEAGRFANSDSAIEEALSLLQEREEKLAWLRAEIQIGIDELDRGEGITLDENSTKELVKDSASRGRARLARERGNAAE